MSNNTLIILLIIILVIGGGYYFLSQLDFQGPAPKTEIKSGFTEFSTEHTALYDVKNGKANGEANRSGKNQMFFFGLGVKNLPKVTGAKFYAVWLSRNANSAENKDMYYAGRLSPANEGLSKDAYVLGFTTKNDLRPLTRVRVTLEEKDDQIPETVVLEGNF